MRISKVHHIGIQLVPLEIITHRHAPLRKYLIDIGGREINFLLAIGIIHMNLRLVIINIPSVVIGVLCQETSGELISHRLLYQSLYKGIMVPLPFTPSPYIIDDSTRYSSLRMVGICLHIPIAIGDMSTDVFFGSKRPDVTIVTDGCSIVSHGIVLIHTLIAELVSSTRG